MPGSQPGCEETRFTGDEKPAPWLAHASHLTKKDSERAVTAKMRLLALVTLCRSAVHALAPTKVRALCLTTSSGRLSSSKKEPA